MFRNSFIHKVPLTIRADHATGLRVLDRGPHFYVVFRFLLVLATGLPVLDHSNSHFLLLLDAIQDPAKMMLEMQV